VVRVGAGTDGEEPGAESTEHTDARVSAARSGSSGSDLPHTATTPPPDRPDEADQGRTTNGLSRTGEALRDLKRRVALAVLDEKVFPEITHEKKRAYLVAVIATGSRTEAAEVAGISRGTPYGPVWRNDAVLQAALRQAEEASADLLEAEARRRAVQGVEEPVGWYKGKPGGYVRKYSDVLLIFLLKGLRPDKYKDRMEFKGTWKGKIDVQQLPPVLLERMARGEHPASVLASALPKMGEPAGLLGPGEADGSHDGGGATPE